MGRLLSNFVQSKFVGPKYKYNRDFWEKQE